MITALPTVSRMGSSSTTTNATTTTNDESSSSSVEALRMDNETLRQLVKDLQAQQLNDHLEKVRLQRRLREAEMRLQHQQQQPHNRVPARQEAVGAGTVPTNNKTLPQQQDLAVNSPRELCNAKDMELRNAQAEIEKWQALAEQRQKEIDKLSDEREAQTNLLRQAEQELLQCQRELIQLKRQLSHSQTLQSNTLSIHGSGHYNLRRSKTSSDSHPTENRHCRENLGVFRVTPSKYSTTSPCNDGNREQRMDNRSSDLLADNDDRNAAKLSPVKRKLSVNSFGTAKRLFEPEPSTDDTEEPDYPEDDDHDNDDEKYIAGPVSMKDAVSSQVFEDDASYVPGEHLDDYAVWEQRKARRRTNPKVKHEKVPIPSFFPNRDDENAEEEIEEGFVRVNSTDRETENGEEIEAENMNATKPEKRSTSMLGQISAPQGKKLTYACPFRWCPYSITFLVPEYPTLLELSTAMKEGSTTASSVYRPHIDRMRHHVRLAHPSANFETLAIAFTRGANGTLRQDESNTIILQSDSSLNDDNNNNDSDCLQGK